MAVKSGDTEAQMAVALEKNRQAGAHVQELLAKESLSSISIVDVAHDKASTLAFLEGLYLANYTFQKYKSEQKPLTLQEVVLYSTQVEESDLQELTRLCDAIFVARDMVNEPLIHLTAEDFAQRCQAWGQQKGVAVTVLEKKQLEALKMGGLLAINAGSINPPTFTILEYHPQSAVNTKPIVLVGKGVVYDTGGLSLKPTPNSMDYMKCDMAGGAAVVATIMALADNKLPVHVVGLVPATENRLDGNAITPGDVVAMYGGKTVEIMNTDAEGRIILADALTYAAKYDPELVIDVATLTGSAVAAIGNKGIIYMGTASEEIKQEIERISYLVHERLVQLPLWEEYDKYIESDIADLKNLGGADSGAIIGGKFLQHFVAFPWLHLDIAAMAYLHQKESYKGKGGTGASIRLLYHFIKDHYLKNG